jgi:transposase
MDEEGYEFFARRVPKDARIAFEATGIAYPVYRRLRSLGYNDITVAHAKQLAWIVKSKKKNDRADSLKIAKLHQAGMLPEAHLLDREERVKRDLLIERVKLSQEIGDIKKKIISYLKREEVYNTLPETYDNFSASRREAMLTIKFNDERDLVLKTMMDRLEFLEKQSTPLEVRIKAMCVENHPVRVLMSTVGVDLYLASLLCSFIGDVNRFPSDDHLASYLGVIPVCRDTSETKRRGGMSREGPAIARWALGLATENVVRYNKHIHDYFEAALRRSGSRDKARVLAMKKLVRMIYHMLKTGDNWMWEKPSLTRRKIRRLITTAEKEHGSHTPENGGDS